MSQILKLTHENQQLKRQINQYQQVLGVSPYVNDSLFKGGYRVVKTINDRDKIDCCHRKQGMKVIVVGEDLSFKEYILKTNSCKENVWEEVKNLAVEENEVFLIEDYSELSEDLITQKDLNLVLKQSILNLQTQINLIELSDEKVQITEATNFAQIGQTQKDFNKSVSDYKEIVDIKNIEQDERIENLEGINYTWSPTNRTLTLFDNNGTQLSQVSLVSLDNEGTDIRYNASTLSLELYNANNELLDSIPVSSFIGSVGTQLQLNSNQLQLKDSQGKILSTVNFSVSNINGLQTALDGKLDTPLLSHGQIPYWHNLYGNVNNFLWSGMYVYGSNIGVEKPTPDEKFEVNGNVKSNSYKFSLQEVLTPQPNTLIAKTDGSGLIWYNNNSIGNDIAFKSELLWGSWQNITLINGATATEAKVRKNTNGLCQLVIIALKKNSGLSYEQFGTLPSGYAPSIGNNLYFPAVNVNTGKVSLLNIQYGNSIKILDLSAGLNDLFYSTMEYQTI